MQRRKKCPQCGAKAKCTNIAESPSYHWFSCESIEFDDGKYAFSEDCNTAYMDKLVVIVSDLRK